MTRSHSCLLKGGATITMISGSSKNIVPTAVGLGTVVLVPIAAVVLIGAFKPVARMAIRGSVLAGALVRSSAAAAVTTLKDLAAEAKAELEANSAKKRG
jgi:hypothetical protein